MNYFCFSTGVFEKEAPAGLIHLIGNVMEKHIRLMAKLALLLWKCSLKKQARAKAFQGRIKCSKVCCVPLQCICFLYGRGAMTSPWHTCQQIITKFLYLQIHINRWIQWPIQHFSLISSVLAALKVSSGWCLPTAERESKKAVELFWLVEYPVCLLLIVPTIQPIAEF